MLELIHFNILSVLLFSVGLYGVLARKSAILIIMAIELMLNAVNINFIAAAAFKHGFNTLLLTFIASALIEVVCAICLMWGRINCFVQMFSWHKVCLIANEFAQ